ncbi:MAG: hypothetical protein SV775_13965 [Thermodesulfobacteriota bacterium]|nr:hypothetical protein [Thermodesulfobacteriota bacterium]
MDSEKRSEKEEIVVLDKGIETDTMADPKGICCSGAFAAIR